MIRILAVFCLFSSVVVADDWERWLGPDGVNVSRETGLLDEWAEGGPKLLWRLDEIGDGYGTVSVVGDRFYIVGNDGMDDEFVEARRVTDGARIWRTTLGPVGDPDQQPHYPKARSTPAVIDGVVYALSSDGDLAAVQAATGEKLWSKSLRRDFGGRPGKWAYGESPLVDGDAVVVTPGGPEATIVALNKSSGELIWKSAVPGGDIAAYSSPVAAEAAGRKQYIQFLDAGVVGVDAGTGEFLWRYTKTSTGPANIAQPIAHNDYVYSSNSRRFGGGLVKLEHSASGMAAQEVYFERYAPNTLGGQVLIEGVLYGTNQQGLVSVDFMTGKVRWQAGGGPGSVLYADGHLYIHWEAGDVSLVEADPDEFVEKGRFTPNDPDEHLLGSREMAWSFPVVANGRLYVRDMGVLWCYDVSR